VNACKERKKDEYLKSICGISNLPCKIVQLYDIHELSSAADNSSEMLRKELTDIRRQLTDSNYEKEKYNSSNKELRDYVKRIEGEKREQGRALEEAFQKISSKLLVSVECS
jgi:molecular chaperone GrpE (heat shock protein)